MNSQSATPHASSDAGVGNSFKESWVIPLLGFTVILVVMNTMMFNLALPKITIDFSLSPVAASWIVTGYSIVFAISSITYSRLSDFVPIRKLFTIGLLSLGGASVLGFFSHHFVLLLMARLIQASGAASVPALGIVLLTRYIPLSRRGKSMSIVMSASSLGLGLGPVIGGSITQYLGWNDLFLVTAVTLLLTPVFYKLLPNEQPQRGSFDIAGAVLIAIGTTGSLLFLTNRSWWMLAAGVLALVLFWMRIRRTNNPFVQPSLFGNKSFMNLNAIGIMAYMSSFVTLFLVPQILAHLYALTPGQSGLVLFPGAVLSMLASTWIGKMIDRFGNSMLFRYAPWLLIAAAALFALLAVHSVYAIVVTYMLLSVSFSALTTSVSNEISRIVPKEHIGAGMGLFQLLQFFSGAFSVAVTGTSLTMQKSLPLPLAYTNIFWGMTVVAAIAIICSLLYRAEKQGASLQTNVAKGAED
ncbi:MFS transporter [Paenibacillus sp. OAS669]|uniref:MFS transporter n=1 Tax=Paenibacillus sp. OAS669 TaxID=2663821 RepID=UPI00178AD85A|nr:MFS transporter [Paenibacillus sp. OAS669]MBE1446697.1 DHA2 family metal-tetracycline-proton antiporter-like MFS transporter [Paenibacillus sp. OAS669]